MTIQKKDLDFNWNKIYYRLKNNINTSGYWGTTVTVGSLTTYNCRLCNGTLLLAYLRGVDTTNAASTVQTVYTNCSGAGYLATASHIQNVPSLDPALANRLYWGGDPNFAFDLWTLHVGKDKLSMTIGDLPHPQVSYNLWTAGAQPGVVNYVDSIDGKKLYTNRDASSYTDGFAQNQMLNSAMPFLFADEAHGLTNWRTTANSILSGWKTKFATLAAEKADTYYEGSVSYRTTKVLSMLMIMYKLHSYGTITSAELATYLAWYKDWVDELATTTFTNYDCYVEMIAAEMLYAQMLGRNYIPTTYTSDSFSTIMDRINNYQLCGNVYPFLYLAWTYWTTTSSSPIEQIYKAFTGRGTVNVTLYSLQLGSRDSTTGWCTKQYASSTIKMVIASKGNEYHTLPHGVFAKYDAVGVTLDLVKEGDKIKTDTGVYYEVKSVTPHYIGSELHFRECQLVKLPFGAL